MKDTLSAGASSPPSNSLGASLDSGPISTVERPCPSEVTVPEESMGANERFDPAARPLLTPPHRASSPVILAILEASHLLRNAIRVTVATLCVISVYLFLLHPAFGGYVAVGLPLCVILMGSLRLVAVFARALDRSGNQHYMRRGNRFYRLMVEMLNLAVTSLGALILAGSILFASIVELPPLGVVAAVALLLLVLIDPATTRSAKRRESDHRQRTRLQRQTLEALQVARNETQAVANISTDSVSRSKSESTEHIADRNQDE